MYSYILAVLNLQATYGFCMGLNFINSYVCIYIFIHMHILFLELSCVLFRIARTNVHVRAQTLLVLILAQFCNNIAIMYALIKTYMYMYVCIYIFMWYFFANSMYIRVCMYTGAADADFRSTMHNLIAKGIYRWMWSWRYICIHTFPSTCIDIHVDIEIYI